MKACSKCKRRKELEEFAIDKRCSDGRRSDCKECQQKYRNRRKAVVDTRDWRLLNPEMVMLHRAQQRAKKGGYLCTITKEDIIIPKVCPILGMPLNKAVGSHCRMSPSLDRKNTSLGYVRGNVQVISYQANTMKNNATPEELLIFGRWAVRTYGN